MVVLRVCLQMLGQLLDARGEERNLDFRGAAIRRGPGVSLNNLPLAGDLEGHQVLLFSLFLYLRQEPSRGVPWSKGRLDRPCRRQRFGNLSMSKNALPSKIIKPASVRCSTSELFKAAPAKIAPLGVAKNSS